MAGYLNRHLLAAIALGAAASASAATVDWTVVDLGALGGANSYASALSDSGFVAGCAETADGAIHAFLYQAGSMRDLGAGCGLAVDNNGAVAGRDGSGGLVVWASGGVTSLGIRGNVGGMNDSGVVVGARATGTSTRAFIYRDGVVADLGEPTVRSEANAINARGEIVGSMDGHAFLYRDGAMRDLGTLGGNNSVARGINTRGEVVGQASNQFGQPTPFVYSGAMQPLAGPGYSSAIAINTSGQVIASGEGVHGYLVEGGIATRLADIPSVAARGLRNLEPTAINERGWIAGTAENAQGELRAFLLMPGARGKPYRPAGR
jgi:probable HAF family extracellular repeat protein